MTSTNTHDPIVALDLFAGSGWAVGARRLGIKDYGVEIMPEAVATREANGFETIFNDVWDGLEDPSLVPEYDLLIASPPCQGYSMAGKGSGRKALDDVLNMLDSEAYANPTRLRDFGQHGVDERDVLVLTPLAYIARGRPRYVALEQVPAVLPVWEAYAERMREWGYDVKVATLHAEQYGVPQTRKRAILVAKLGGEAHLPTPTHSRYHSRSPQKLDEGVKKWVSMAEALGWGMAARPEEAGSLQTYPRGWGFTDRPAVAVGNAVGRGLIGGSGAKASVVRAIEDGSFIPSVHGKDDSYAEQTRITVEEAGALQSYPTAVKNMGAGMVERHGERPGREADQPAFTIRAAAGGGEPGGFKWSDGEKMTAEQASTFQTYPTEPPFTFCGTKTKVMLQIGNAVPPLLATHILEALVYGTQEVAQQYELSRLRPSGNMATSFNDDNQEVEDGRTSGRADEAA